MILNCFHFLCKFVLELENWGVDVNELKEIAISRNFVGWTNNWEKEKRRVDGSVNKVLFANMYEDMHFILPDIGHLYYTWEEDVVYRGRYG